MESEKKAEDKNALREKNRISAKQFIKMKRGKIKQEKANSESFQEIRNHIRQGKAKQLEQSLFSTKDQVALTFLFSEDELKQTPMMEIITNKEFCSLMKCVNKWSCKNSDLIVRVIYMEDNQLRNNDFRGKFHNINKTVLEVLNKKVTQEQSIAKEIEILGEKDSLYYHLSKNFLNLELIISSLSILKTKNNMLTLFYQELLNKSDLKELKDLASQAKGYQSIVLRQKLWNKVDAGLIKTINKENIGLLTLKELNYNIWHQLASHSPSQFLKITQALIDKMNNNEAIAEDLHTMLLTIDSSAEIVLDKCLRIWGYKQIKQILSLSSKIQNLMLSTKCLIKIFYNRNLSQSDRESLIKECLSGEISKKGYIKVIPKILQRSCKLSGSEVMLQKKPIKYTYNIVYDTLEIKKQKDTSGTYPLIIYLSKYKKTAKLQIIQLLLIQSLTPKHIKKQMMLLIKNAVKNNLRVQDSSQKRQEIQNIFDYYQPLWKAITFLPHNDALEYLLSKIFINCFEIKLVRHWHHFNIQPVNTHFIAFYIQNSPYLGEDGINKKILSSIINCKANQKKIGQINLDIQLIRSLNKIDLFHKSTEYLIVQLRKHLKTIGLNLTSDDLMSRRQVQVSKESSFNELVIDTLCYPLLRKKASILSQEQIVSKLNPEMVNQLLDRNQDLVFTNGQFKKYYKDLFSRFKILPQNINKAEFQSLSHSTITSVQDYYISAFKSQNRNQNFFNGLEDYFSSINTISQCWRQKSLRYYCFRLRPTEKYLTFKFKKLLGLGMDVYFSIFDKCTGFNEQNQDWNTILQRMFRTKCSFLVALISEPTISFDSFKEIFENQSQTETQWIKWSLFKKIKDMFKRYLKEQNQYQYIHQKIDFNYIQDQFYFCKNKSQICNYQFITNLTTYAQAAGYSQKLCVQIMRVYFQINLKQFGLQISKLESQDKGTNSDKNKAAVEKKKVNVVAFIEKWMPQLINYTQKVSKTQNSQQFTDHCYSYYIKLLQQSFYKGQDYIWKTLLRYQSFQIIPIKVNHTKFHLFKFKYSSSPSNTFSKFILNLSNENIIAWIEWMMKYQIKLLIDLIHSLQFQSQTKIMLNVIQRMQSQGQTLALQITRTYNTFIKVIIRSVDPKRGLQLLRILESQPLRNQDYKRQILSSVQDTQKAIVSLIVLNPYNNKSFYLKDQKIKLFNNASFYHKCSQNLFDIYVKNLQKYHSSSSNIKIHLKTVITCLVQSQQWQRLKAVLSIRPLLKETIILSLEAIATTYNKKVKQGIPLIKQLTTIIFSQLQNIIVEFDQKLFHFAFSVDYRQAFKVFKPKALTLDSFKKCIQTCPQCSSLLLAHQVGININEKPSDKYMLTYFPIVARHPMRLGRDKWLIDQLRVEHFLFKELKALGYLFKFQASSFCICEQALQYKAEIYDGLIDDRQICLKILKNNQVKSITQYRKYIPNIDTIIKEQLIKSNNPRNMKHKCINLNSLHPDLLKYFIQNKFLSSADHKDLYSTFLRILETAKLNLIQLFTSVNHITIDYKFLKGMEDQGFFVFWHHLLSIINQDFIIAFITKYKLFSIFPTQEYSQYLLNTICRLKLNKLFEFTIKYFEAQSGKKAIFAGQTFENKPSISDKGVFYLPIQQSIDSNFYQTYFLIKSSKNDCLNFKSSGRFITYNNPEQWNYIPELKRRVDINNTFMVSLREAQEMTFRLDVLLPSIFQFQMEGEPTQIDPYQEPKGLKRYIESLKKFILDITKKTLHLTPYSGKFQKLSFMLFNQNETKIPQEELQKKYPAEMKLIIQVKKFIEDQQLRVPLETLFSSFSQFKPLLLIYNPTAFLTNPDYMDQLMGKQQTIIDFSQYLRGIQINFVQFQTKYPQVLQGYIINYFFTSSIPLGDPTASFHLTREALLLIFLEISHHQRNWKECPIFNLCKANMKMINTHQLEEQTLYDLSTFLNIRAKGKMAFDLMVWNKIIQEIEEIEKCWKTLGKPAIKQYNFNPQTKNRIISNYSKIATKQMQRYQIGNINTILSEVYEDHISNCNKKGTLIEMSMVLNILLLQNDIKMLDQKIKQIKGGANIEKYNIKLVRKIQKQIAFSSPTQLTLQVKYSIQKHQSHQLSLLFIDYNTTIQTLQHSLYLSNLKQTPNVQDLNVFCQAAQRQSFLKNYKFIYTVSSFNGLKYESLLSMLEHGHFKKDGIVGKMMYQMEKLEEKLIGTKNIKVYSTSDIYGPINFSEEKEDEKIIDCLGFYQLIQLPKDEEIKITYTEKKIASSEQNQLMLKQLKSYLAYYLAHSKDDDHSNKLKLQNQILITLQQVKNSEKVEIQWWKFGAWAICEIYCLALHYCSDLSSKIEKILDVRVSFSSIVTFYQKYLEYGGQQCMKIALQKFLFDKEFSRLIECIVLMITEDVSNIMKIVKGIIIKWDINKKTSKKRGKIVIGESTRAVSVEYQVKDGLLIIKVNLQMEKQLNKADEKGDDCNILVDRKEFLDSVFTSAQFLADYFLVRNQLNNTCLTISTSTTSKLNSTVNFHIEYSNLYKFVDRMRKDKTIKEIESFLVRLKQYLQNTMDKTVNLYLNSQEIANKHQVFLINKCQAIKKNVPYEKIEGQKQLIYDSLQTDPQNGLYQVSSLMNQIGNDQNIKSAFLIQIYKSYYTTIVGQGMTFVAGYKSNKKKAQVIKITKAQNINLINIVQLDYIMLVSKNIPTNDELNKNKIIRIFITDSNKNLYRLHDQIKDYFLSLPEENQARSIADFAPLVASNIKLNFYLDGERQKDTKETKIFFIDLNESGKFKLSPLPDKPLTPLNSCKKNIEFKQAISQLQKSFKSFFNHSMKIIIDLPQQFSEKYMNADFSRIVSLVSTDIQQFLMKYQFQPMRNQSLDCKLSVERQFILNKNSIIQLRKLALSNHFDKIRIRIRDNKSGITFEEGQIVIGIDTTNMATLPSSSQYLSVIVDRILSQQNKKLPKYVSFVQTQKNESTQILLKELDLINCIPYQVEQIETAISLIELLFGTKLSGYRICIDKKKSEIKFKEEIQLHFSVESIQREFYSAEEIIKAYIISRNKNMEENIKSQTYYSPITKTITIQDSCATKFKLICQDSNKKWKSSEVVAHIQISKAIINFGQNCPVGSRYYLLQSQNLYCNFFYSVDPSLAIKQKNSQGIRCKSKYLYLSSKKSINLNFTNISFIETDPVFKENTASFHILKKGSDKNKIVIKLISKNIYLLDIIYEESMIVDINYVSNTNIFNSEIGNSKIVISSDGEVCLDRTKFIEMEAYKKKPVLIKQKQNENNNSQFRQNNQLASSKDFDLKLGDTNNIQNLVYVVNDQCKKYLTRAGEPRVDYIQLCDTDSNPIDYKSKLQVMFVHINRLAIIKPQVFNRSMQFGLRWTPTVRGHYYLYINNVRMNPPYEIGVCAAQADYKTSIVTLPKIKKICYCQETELMLDLRDHFNNLYTQLEEDIIGDQLVIELKCSKMGQNLKIDKSQINKYGLKKVKFNFNNSEADASSTSEVIIEVCLNLEPVTTFSIIIEGLSLKQRKKFLEKDIGLSSKNYYKDISVNRHKFLQDLFVIAQKSLHTNISVKFVNEPGIDAGGVKRQFYDMIGNEIKNEKNPFFKLINPNTMEYFLNPEILRNKKKLQYMQLWGKYLANSFLNSYLVGVSFSPVFVKLLYDQSIDYEDLLSVLPEQEKKQYQFLLKASPSELEDLDLFFTVMVDKKKCVEAELKEGGKQIQVNSSNVKEYLECTAQILVTERYKQIIIAFRKGFQTVLQLGLFKKWIRPSQFWCLTAGSKQITPELVLNYIVFQGSNIDNISGWFRRFITESNHEVLVGFLKFSSGSSSIDFSLASKITVTFENAGDNPKKLPISHTCWKEIVVPKYKNYDIMKKLLTAAFIYCSEGFGFG